MKLNNPQASIFIPDSSEESFALKRTTDLCIAAHQDDIEIMAYSPIAKCFDQSDKWFTGVVVTDGAGSPRSGIYGKYSDEDMKQIRTEEQKVAATIGKYSAMLQLGYSSKEVKAVSSQGLDQESVHKKESTLVQELSELIEKTSPGIVYTHNLADKHDTHVAVAMRTIEAIKLLPKGKRPKKIYSLEVWRGLDWLCDEDKTIFDTSPHPNLAAALLGVFDSQIAGGKRYDLAAIGRRTANATFFASHDVDSSDSVSYGLDISELVNDETLSPEDFITRYLDNFKNEIIERMRRLC